MNPTTAGGTIEYRPFADVLAEALRQAAEKERQAELDRPRWGVRWAHETPGGQPGRAA